MDTHFAWNSYTAVCGRFCQVKVALTILKLIGTDRRAERQVQVSIGMLCALKNLSGNQPISFDSACIKMTWCGFMRKYGFGGYHIVRIYGTDRYINWIKEATQNSNFIFAKCKLSWAELDIILPLPALAAVAPDIRGERKQLWDRNWEKEREWKLERGWKEKEGRGMKKGEERGGKRYENREK